jgi:hypothetical protein
MVQFVFCILMLLPLIGLPVAVFLANPLLGVLLGIVSLVLAIPLVLAAVAHFDLHRVKSRYGLSEEELDEFSRLVPRLAARPEFARLRPRDLKRSTKDAAAADIIRRRGDGADRTAAGADDEATHPARGAGPPRP